MRKYQYQIYYHTSRGRYFIKIRYSFLGLVFWLTLRDKYSSNIETFLDKDKAIERAEDYLRYLYLKRKNSRVLRLLGVALMILLWPIVFIYALNDGIEGYPFKKYAIPYIFILVAWFIIFLYELVS